MKTHQWRIEMRLTPGGRELMRFLMRQQDLTIERLADKCGKPKSRATIGHLLTGYRAGCRDDLALAIEKQLLGGAYANSELRLFTPQVSRVAGNTQRPVGRAA